jgi:hypothetical protein
MKKVYPLEWRAAEVCLRPRYVPARYIHTRGKRGFAFQAFAHGVVKEVVGHGVIILLFEGGRIFYKIASMRSSYIFGNRVSWMANHHSQGHGAHGHQI